MNNKIFKTIPIRKSFAQSRPNALSVAAMNSSYNYSFCSVIKYMYIYFKGTNLFKLTLKLSTSIFS